MTVTRREFLKYATLLPFIDLAQFVGAKSGSTAPHVQTASIPRPWKFAKARGGDGLAFPAYFVKERGVHDDKPYKSYLSLVTRDG